MRNICDRHNILLIFDEVITAFGRLGGNTGAEVFGVTPDIITLAKQLTNGAIPMGAVAVKQEIHDCFMDNGGPDYAVELPHGYTYSAHPVACAAGIAVLDLIEREQLVERAKQLAPVFEDAIHSLKGSPFVTDIRNVGLAGGLSIEHAPGEPLRRPFEIALSMWKKGFYIRYGGDTIQLGLPFTTQRQELDALINALAETLNETA